MYDDLAYFSSVGLAAFTVLATLIYTFHLLEVNIMLL